MVPKASVTMARYGPVTRSAGTASAAPRIAVIAIAEGIASQKGQPAFTKRRPAAYAPMPKSAAWPSDTSPVYPTTMSRPKRRIA